jgi:nucleoside-triphosphatase THEP1
MARRARPERGSRRRVTIITGPRDSGKTRTAAGLAEVWKSQEMTVGGVISEAVLSGGRKVRYQFQDLLTGARAVYAVLRPSPIPAGVPAYEFLAEGLLFGCRAIFRALEGATALVVDEIGPLEMAGGGLWEPARKAVTDFPGRVVLTVRPSLLEELLSRLGLDRRAVEVVMAR